MRTQRRKRNIAGFYDDAGRFRPIRSPQYVGTPKRRATVRDRKKYSRAKAGDLGAKRQSLAREDVFDREIRLAREEQELTAKDRAKIEREIMRDLTEGGSRMATGKPQTLVQFVRGQGGINTELRKKRGRVMYGDLANFTLKDSGTRGLVTTVKGKGKSLDAMHQLALEAGFNIGDMNGLLDALDEEIRNGKPTYATHGFIDYTDNPNMDVSGELRVMQITPKSYGVFLRKWCLKKFRTKAAAETYRATIRARAKAAPRRNPPKASRLAKSAIAVFDMDLDLDLDVSDLSKIKAGEKVLRKSRAKRKPVKKNPIHPITAFAAGASGLLSALQIKEIMNRPKQRRGTTTAKRRTARKNPVVSARANSDVTFHEKAFDRLLSAIEDGNLTQIRKAKLEGRLAGYSPREVEYLIYRSRMASALKRNPAPAVVTEATKLVGNGGRFKRFLARRKAASAFRKELRLEAALERARSRKKQHIKAATNPADKVQKHNRLVRQHAELAAQIKQHWPKLGSKPTVALKRLVKRQETVSLQIQKLAGFKVTIPSAKRRTSAKKPAVRKANAGSGIVKNAVVVPARKSNGILSRLRVRKHRRGQSALAERVGGRVWRVSGTDRYSGERSQIAETYVARTKTEAIKQARQSFPSLKSLTARVENPKARASAKSPMKAAPRKRNAAPRSRTFEMFQGRKPTNAKPMIVSRHAPNTLAQLGDLIELKLHGQAPIKFNPRSVKLCAANGKLWIVGKRFAKSNPAARANEINPIAEIDHVVYGTQKPHHGDHAYTHYIHKLGEESGRRPILAVDREGFPVIRGGNYKIEARGIVD